MAVPATYWGKLTRHNYPKGQVGGGSKMKTRYESSRPVVASGKS